MADSALTTAQLADNPVGLWVLDDAQGSSTVVNRGSSGSGFNGTVGANVVLGSPALIAGSTCAFITNDFSNPNPAISPKTSASNFVSCIVTPRDTANAHGMQPTSEMTVEAFVQWDTNNGSDGGQCVMSYGGPSESNGAPPWTIYNANDAGWSLESEIDDTGTTILSSSWTPDSSAHLITLRYSVANNKYDLFVDGTNVKTAAASGSIGYTDSGNPGLIIGGGWGPIANGTFQGSICNVAIYNSALSDSRIAAHAQAVSAPANPGVTVSSGPSAARFKPMLVRRTKDGFIVFG